MSFIYPSLLRPTTTETLLIDGQEIAIPKLELQLRRWAGQPIADTFGGKPTLDFGGRPLFAELCIYEIMRLSGWEARWIETYAAPAKNPKCFTTWQPDKMRGEQPHELLATLPDQQLLSLLRKITTLNNDSYAGCWDVLGWHEEAVVFAELKRYKKDRLQPTQPRWLAAGFAAGLRPENFLLVEWDFADK